MNGFFKTLLAGYGAKKLGGGCWNNYTLYHYLLDIRPSLRFLFLKTTCIFNNFKRD